MESSSEPAATSTSATAGDSSSSTTALDGDRSSDPSAIHPDSTVCGICSDFVCQLRSVGAVCGMRGTQTLRCLNATELTCSQDGNLACQCVAELN